LTCSKMGAPMVMLGTKWPSMTSGESAVIRVYDVCHHTRTGSVGIGLVRWPLCEAVAGWLEFVPHGRANRTSAGRLLASTMQVP
jgi:hypothetical protein